MLKVFLVTVRAETESSYYLWSLFHYIVFPSNIVGCNLWCNCIWKNFEQQSKIIMTVSNIYVLTPI